MSWKPPRHFNNPQQTTIYGYVAPPPQISSPPPQPQKFYNGAVAGNNYVHSPKPTNLSNSAVLRMLHEQEEEQKNNGLAQKEVVWPPPHEESVDGQNYPLENEQYLNSQDSQNSDPYSGYPYRAPIKKFQPPPTTITLRDSPPISQDSAPVYRSQPAADTLKGGFRMRGDLKWPPPEYKVQAAEENQARIQLAKGPAFRPLKVKKDYNAFFAKNALPGSYPGYKAPPGTQHYYDSPGTDY